VKSDSAKSGGVVKSESTKSVEVVKSKLDPSETVKSELKSKGDGLKSDTKSKLDAGADGVSVRVTEGLMAFTADDEGQLAAVVAHEMSHNLLGHRQRLAATGNSNKQILETEIEADRLSVWLMANAGYDTQAALHFMERYGRRTDLGIFSAGTHLRWKNRQKVMQREIALIKQTVAENRPLTPPLLGSGKM
jgi:hypothetical protein